jgi:hypothetical protein
MSINLKRYYAGGSTAMVCRSLTGKNLQNHFYCPVSLQRFINDFPVGFAFHCNLHIERVVFVGFAAAGRSY